MGISLAFPFLKSIIISFTSSESVSFRKIEQGEDLDRKCEKDSRGEEIAISLSLRTFSFKLLARDVKYSLNLFAIIRLQVILVPSISKSPLD